MDVGAQMFFEAYGAGMFITALIYAVSNKLTHFDDPDVFVPMAAVTIFFPIVAVLYLFALIFIWLPIAIRVAVVYTVSWYKKNVK